jgi:hypothetical protein
MNARLAKPVATIARSEGIPSPPQPKRGRLPREGDLLNADSPRTSHQRQLEEVQRLVYSDAGENGVSLHIDRMSALSELLPMKAGMVFGLDLGTTSIGLSVIQDDTILSSYVHIFDLKQQTYKGVSQGSIRHQARSTRAHRQRRRRRLNAVRMLLISAGLPDPLSLLPAGDVYQMRAEGVDRLLSPAELSAVLYVIAKRRGFDPKRPLATKSTAQKSTNDRCHMEHISSLRWRLTQYRTVGEMLSRDGFFVSGGGKVGHGSGGITLLRAA